jgi:head-tail adaptor
MATRKVKKRPLQKSPVGDMRDRIGLYTRNIAAPVFNSAVFTEAYTLLFERWAKVVTVERGRIIFGDVDTGPQEQPSHIFTIRYESSVTKETRILWRSEYYEILKIVDPEGRRQYLNLHAKIEGDSSLTANQ